MKSRIILILMAIMIASYSNLLFADSKQGPQLIDRGMDENGGRAYLVNCPDGTRNNITDYPQENKVCADSDESNTGQICRQGWKTREAAKYACSQFKYLY